MLHKLSVGEVYSVVRIVLRNGQFVTYVLCGTPDRTLKAALRHTEQNYNAPGGIYGAVQTRVTYYGGDK